MSLLIAGQVLPAPKKSQYKTEFKRQGRMITLKKILGLTLIATLSVSTFVTVSTNRAEAGHGGSFAAGLAGGIIGFGLLSTYAHAQERAYSGAYDYDASPEVCHKGPQQCGWVGRRCFENSWGEMVCRGGRWSCWRETYCD